MAVPGMEGGLEPETETEFTGTADFGTDTTVLVTVNLGNDVNDVDFSLYGASDDNQPSQDTNPLKSEPGHPASNKIVGTGGFATDQPYTVQVTYSHSGPRVQTAHVRADQAQAGNKVPLHFS